MISYLDYIADIQWFYYAGIMMFLLSIGLFEIKVTRGFALSTLIIGVSLYHTFFLLSDPFLYLWDEQFHALVAKNLLENPFYPYLLPNDLLPTEAPWTDNHVWLHKQPLFLWLISLSFKIFGVGFWQLRLPSALLSILFVFPLYKIGYLIRNQRVGFYAVVLWFASEAYVPVFTGRLHTDHNDMMFAFFVLMSIYFFFQYLYTNLAKYAIAIGIFAGLAILVKWLVGLIVFSAWLIFLFGDAKWRAQWTRYLHLAIALMMTFLIALPWQIYSYLRFPSEYLYEHAVNNAHFLNVIDGHSGTWYFHLDQINILVAKHFVWLVIISLLALLIPKILNYQKYAFTILIYFVVVNGFFMLAATKMPLFTFPVFSMAILAVAVFIDFGANWISDKFKSLKINKSILSKYISLSLFLILSFGIFGQKEFKNHEDWHLDFWRSKATENLIYKSLEAKIPSKTKSMVFNFRDVGNVRFSFITSIQARMLIPTTAEIEQLRAKGIQIYVLDNNDLPDYVLNDKNIIKVKSAINEPYNFSTKLLLYR
jgi:4-amino-4-deoxy-L-arabinose transferase